MQLVAPLSLPATTLWVVFEHAPEVITVPTSMLQYVTNAYLQNFVDWPTPACKSESGKESEAEPDRQMLDSTESSDSSDSHVTSAFLLFVSAVWMTLI